MIITHIISLNLPSGRVRPANDDSCQSSSRVVHSVRTSDTQVPERKLLPLSPSQFSVNLDVVDSISVATVMQNDENDL